MAVSKQLLSRRSFLAVSLKTTLAAIIGGVIKVVPEAASLFAADGGLSGKGGDLTKRSLPKNRIEKIKSGMINCPDVVVLSEFLRSQDFAEVSHIDFGMRVGAKVPSGKRVTFDHLISLSLAFPAQSKNRAQP